MSPSKEENPSCSRCGHPVEKRFLEGRERRYCPQCTRILYDNPVPVVTAVVLKGPQVLLVKRGIEPRRGWWSLPSGFIEVGENAQEALVREILEETSVSIVKVRPLPSLSQEGVRYASILILPFLADYLSGTPLGGDDAAEAAFFPLSDLPELAFPSHRLILESALASL